MRIILYRGEDMEQLYNLYIQQPGWLQAAIGLTLLAALAIGVNYLLKHVILRLASPYLDRQTKTIDKAAAWLATVAPLTIVSEGIWWVPHLNETFQRVTSNVAASLIVLSLALAMVKALTYINELYERRQSSRERPIKGFLQVLKIIIMCGAGIIMVSALIEQSPIVLLTGLGAITAVVLLVFKDTILSLVASIQLTTNDMLRVGDWIEMPAMNADGDVIDISLHTVKVQNFDKTITTIPTHRLVADSFRNWRGMSEAGGRRIKRSLVIDQSSVRFLSDEEVVALKKFKMLTAILTEKREEIADWNARELSGDDAPVNARRLTNIGLFRAYILAYLKWHPRISDNFTRMVRQLPPSAQGVPLEIYCFTDTTDWNAYEGIQADIFDHLMAIIPEFHLHLFQEPAGRDFALVAARD